MKYKLVYPDAPAKSYPEQFLERTGRWTHCCVCDSKTEWADWTQDCFVPICSEECRKKTLDDYIEVMRDNGNVEQP